MWRRSRTWNSGQVFCPRAHVNSLANKCFTLTLSCLLLIVTLCVNYKQSVASITPSSRWQEQLFFISMVSSKLHHRQYHAARNGWHFQPFTSHAISDPLFGLVGFAELCGLSEPAGRGRPSSRGSARAAPPGQRGAVTSGARPRPTRALQFTETLLALKLIIHHWLSIFEQGLYLRGSRFNHLVSNRFKSHGPWGGGRETVTVTCILRKTVQAPLSLSPYANLLPSIAGPS